MTARSCALIAAGLLLGLTTGCCRFCDRWCGHDYHPQQQCVPCCVPVNPCAPGPYTGGYIQPQAQSCLPPQAVPYTNTGTR